MGNKQKKISILIPYNKDRGFLAEAIRSVECQTYGNIELILSQSDANVSYNLNRGIERCSGDYIKYLCEDDILPPDAVEESVKAMDGFDFIHGNAVNFFPEGKMITYKPAIKYPTLRDMLHKNVIHGGTLMYDRKVFDGNLFDETLWSSEEYEFNLRLLSRGMKIGYCDHILYHYRRHTDQKSLGNRSKTYQGARDKQRTMIKSKYL